MWVSINRRSPRVPFSLAVCVWLALALPLVGLGRSALAQAVPQYRWDSSWPVADDPHHAEFHQQEGLGVGVDGEGLIYLSHISSPPVMVYDRSGHFVRSWGNGMLSEPHSIRVGPDGTIWVVDRD